MCEIERILRRGASTPHAGYNKEKVEGYKLGIQEVLGILNASNSPFDGTLNASEHSTSLAPIDSHHTATASVSESGTS